MFKKWEIVNTTLGYLKIEDEEVFTSIIISKILNQEELQDLIQKNILTFNI